MIINCTYEKNTWEIELQVLRVKGDLYDLRVSGRGSSFHIIIGSHAYGSFLCIPDIGVGCELAALSDTFWNQESISRHMSNVDAATIVTAIKEVSKLQPRIKHS